MFKYFLVFLGLIAIVINVCLLAVIYSKVRRNYGDNWVYEGSSNFAEEILPRYSRAKELDRNSNVKRNRILTLF